MLIALAYVKTGFILKVALFFNNSRKIRQKSLQHVRKCEKEKTLLYKHLKLFIVLIRSVKHTSGVFK